MDSQKKINYDIVNRWQNGIDHNPKSIELYEKISDIDFKYGYDSFRFKSGGDGDNGERLMYILDVIFEEQENKKS